MRQHRKKTRQKLQQNFGQRKTPSEQKQMYSRMDRIKLYHNEMCEQNAPGDIDDITWNDLQMTEIYMELNHTKSYIGEQVLYHRLHNTTCLDQTCTEFEERVEQFRTHTDIRLNVEEKLSAIGKRLDSYYLAPFLMHSELWTMGNSVLLHTLQALLLIFLTGALVTQHGIFFIGLMVICSVNLLVYLRTKNQYETFLYALGTLKQMLDFGSFLAKEENLTHFPLPKEIAEIIDQMKPLSKKLVGWYGQKMMTLSGDVTALLQDYLFGITLLDISSFNHIMKLINGRQEQLLLLFEYIGETDVCIAVASYRESLPNYCLPEICQTEQITARNLVHPLISSPVSNDFDLCRRAVITGANAAGKSTFMKALAINVILAKTIHTCTASRLCMPDISVMTSMSLRDDVVSGESYYVREARRIRQMLDLEASGKHALLIIDEMLKGTNTSERVCAAVSILSYLAHTAHFIVVATHDTEMLNRLNLMYANYYFDSIVDGGNILFDYHIHAGTGGNTNAIALLSLLEYPQEIIEQAKQEQRTYYENW